MAGRSNGFGITALNRWWSRLVLDGVDDVGKDVADDRTQQEQDGDHDDGNEHQDQRILDQTLAFFAWQKQHLCSLPSRLGFDSVRSLSASGTMVLQKQLFGKRICVNIILSRRISKNKLQSSQISSSNPPLNLHISCLIIISYISRVYS